MDLAPSSQFSGLTDGVNLCPCCGTSGLREFHRFDNIPAQSNAMLMSQRDAADFPVAKLSLAFCQACGFITNTAFDRAAADAEFGYEASQACSPTFGSFAKRLADQWIDRYQLRNRHVIEIGCGQGEFLALLCERGDNQGVGVDPRFKPQRHPAPNNPRLQFIRDLYSPAYRDLPADFICCRHTLEHIPDAGAFVRMVRNVIADRSSIVVGFEVPDTLRVLREGAFWDLYHEHCSYFTPGSLARLFRANQFDVLDCRLEYDGQYLIVEARPTSENSGSKLPIENDLAPVTEAVIAWPGTVERIAGHWRETIRRESSSGRPVALWGSGSKAVGFLTTLGFGVDRIACVVDINPHKQGTFLPITAQPVVAPEFLRRLRPGLVIIMNPVYRNEIAASLHSLEVDATLLTL